MNHRRGITRIFIVVAAVWLLAWAWVYVDTNRKSAALGKKAETSLKDMERQSDPSLRATAGLYVDNVSDAWEAELDRRDRVPWIAGGGLIVLLVSYLAGLWVWRGFKGKH